MGNLCGSVTSKDVDKQTKNVSWNNVRTSSTGTFGKDTSLNREDFIVTGKSNETIIRYPDDIKGQQFVIEDCTNCNIFLFDHVATIQIDACSNCRIVVGPCESSLFVRNAERCVLICAVQQFRTRECSDMDILLYSATEPIIETSKQLRLGCFDLSYFSLTEQLRNAKLSVWNNKWSEVHDFTPTGVVNKNWKFLEASAISLLQEHLTEELKQRIAYSPSTIIIPKTIGTIGRKENEEHCFIGFTNENTALQLISKILEFHNFLNADTTATIHIVRTRLMTNVTSKQFSALFQSTDKPQNHVIGIELQGAQCNDKVKEYLNALAHSSTESITVSLNTAEADIKSDLYFVQWKEVI